MSVVIEASGYVAKGGNITCPAGTEVLLVGIRDVGAAGTTVFSSVTHNAKALTELRQYEHSVNTVETRGGLFYRLSPDTGSAYVVTWTGNGGCMWVALSATDCLNRQSDNPFGNFWWGHGSSDDSAGDKSWSGLRGSSGGMLIDFWMQYANTPTAGAGGENTILASGAGYECGYTVGDGADVTLSVDPNNANNRPCTWFIIDVPPVRSFASSYKISLGADYIEGNTTNLTIPIFGTFNGSSVVDLRSAANGGDVAIQMYSLYHRTTLIPADVIFTSDSEGNTQLDHVIIEWDDTTGYFYAWVKVPSLDATAGTDIYMWVGDAYAGNHESDQTFSENFQYISLNGGEYGWIEIPKNTLAQAVLDFADAVTYRNSGTLAGSAAYGGAGKMSSSALSLAAGTDGLLMSGGHTVGLPDRTVWALFKPTSSRETDSYVFRGRNQYGLGMYLDTSDSKLYMIADEHYNGVNRTVSGGVIADDTWYFGAGIWSDTDDLHYLQLNGAQVGSVAIGASSSVSGESNALLNWGEIYAGTNNFAGLIEFCAIVIADWKEESITVYDMIFNQSSAVTIATPLGFIPVVSMIL